MPPSPSLTQLARETTQRRRARIVVALLAAVALLATAAYGGAGVAWLQPLLALLAAVLGLAASLWGSGPLPRLAAGALSLFALLAAAQIVPLPQSLAQILSPARVAAQRASSSGPAGAGDEVGGVALSYAPLETRRTLTHLALGAAVLAATSLVLRTERSIELMLVALFVVGLAEALVALFQVAASSRGVYGDPALGFGPWFGSYLNHSNFCQQMNLTLGAGIGLLLVRESQRRHAAPRRQERAERKSFLQRERGLLCGLTAVGVAMALSLSRGGLLGAVAGGAALAVALGVEGRLGARAWGLVAVPFVAFVVLAFTGLDTVYDRLGTLHNAEAYRDRGALTLSTLRAGVAHPLVGAGFGAHRYAFPPYDTTGSSLLAEQADNDWAQLFEETGLVGVALTLAFLAAVFGAGRLVLRRSKSPARYAVYGVLYALVACGVQSLSDFGQRLPAVFVMTASLCGVVFALRAGLEHFPIASSRFTLQRVVSCIVVMTAGSWLGCQAWIDYRAERWSSLAFAAEQKLRGSGWQGSDEDYADLLAAAQAAVALRPTDGELVYWLNAYRWQAFTGGGDPTEALSSAEGREVGERLATELAAARRLGPTFGPLHTLEGQVRLALGETEAGARLAAEGFRLAPYDPESCYAAACAACLAAEPDREEVAELLRRCLRLSPAYFGAATELWLSTFADPAVPRSLAAGDIGKLRDLAVSLDASPEFATAAAEVRKEADRLLESQVASGEATPIQFAAQSARLASEGDLEGAVKLIRQALARNPAHIDWRLALCDLLERDGRHDEAYREARRTLRLRPGSPQAIERIKRLSLKIDQPTSTPKIEVE